MHKNGNHLQVTAGDSVVIHCKHTAPVRGTDDKMKKNTDRQVISPTGEAGWQETVRKFIQEELAKNADKTDKETV
jgi:hypothetical protein